MRTVFSILVLFASAAIDKPAKAETPSNGSPYAAAVLADKPISFHRFNETKGTVAADATSNGHDAAYQDNVVLGKASARSALGTAALFDGENSRVQIPAHAAYRFGKGDFTIECWFNCHDTMRGRGDLFTYKGEGKDIGIFKPVGNNNLIAVARPGLSFQAQTDPLSIGVWHHFAYVRRGGVDQCYIDGAPNGTATNHTFVIDMNVDLIIGANHLKDPNKINPLIVWNGLIDEFAIYDKALSAERISAHYRSADEQ